MGSPYVEVLAQREPGIPDAILDAFREVPRREFRPPFVPEALWRNADLDVSLPAKLAPTGEWLSSSSQPSVMASMLELLDLRSGMRVLEIGTGTGFNAAVLSSIVGPHGETVSVEIDEDLASSAASVLSRLGYEVRVEVGDGIAGTAGAHEYDRLIATASLSAIPRAWFEQLRLGGLLVAPIVLNPSMPSVQCIAVFQRSSAGLMSVRLRRGIFLSLRTRERLAAEVPILRAYARERGVQRTMAEVSGRSLELLAADAQRSLLGATLQEPALIRHAPQGEVGRDRVMSIICFIATHVSPSAFVTVRIGHTMRLELEGNVPSQPWTRSALGWPGIIGAASAELAVWQPDFTPSGLKHSYAVAGFGGTASAEMLAAEVSAWERLGYPTLEGMTLEVGADPSRAEWPIEAHWNAAHCEREE